MILYHFTRPEYLDSILAHGLKAALAKGTASGHLNCDNSALAGGQSAVWLTEESDNKPTLEYRRRLLRRAGILVGPKSRHLPESTVCLRTVIPTHDRKLVNLKSFWRHHPDQFVNDKWWFYLGDIPPKRLTVFRHVPVGVTYWDLGWKEEHPQASGFVIPPELEHDLLAGRAGPAEYIAAHANDDGA